MEKINIAELLKDCPKGMELDCTIYSNVTFIGINKGVFPTIKVQTEEGVMHLTECGCYAKCETAKCVIFPKGKTTWEGFQRPFKDGDIVSTGSGRQIFICRDAQYCYFGWDFKDNKLFGVGLWSFWRHATEEEKQKFFKAIKDNGYNWNEETKTLEKLVEVRFKVGNIIQDAYGYKVKITEVNVEDEIYGYESLIAKGIGGIAFSEQNDWKLVPNKFDIKTLKSFESKVLVRIGPFHSWKPAIFGCIERGKYCFVTLGGVCWAQCIPFEGNEHLLGKNDDCDEFYKIWE